ncbi:hypothetical protein R1flu_019352 [Riccia fluitans]|uniref:Uncharacterized protein n=1 Tax=Riccia fluitans TaxID=41844 RepID=A0ABD1ZIE7_9MARC
MELDTDQDRRPTKRNYGGELEEMVELMMIERLRQRTEWTRETLGEAGQWGSDDDLTSHRGGFRSKQEQPRKTGFKKQGNGAELERAKEAGVQGEKSV